MNDIAELARTQQDKLLEECSRFTELPISERARQAFLETPRHWFVQRYQKEQEWHEVSDVNLAEHLESIYTNEPLVLASDGDRVLSTISQPWMVLRMLDVLGAQPGERVFELGTGSGWNAALLSRMVGREGSVVSVDLIRELVERARTSLNRAGIENVTALEADGGEGYEPAGPYDRAVFTAGCHDLPRAFYRDVKDGGRLAMVLFVASVDADVLVAFDKVAGHFESSSMLPCAFLPVSGRYARPPNPSQKLQEFLTESSLVPIASRPYWWAGWSAQAARSFAMTTYGARVFLGLTEPGFRAFAPEEGEPPPFGLWDAEARSLVVASPGKLTSYGSPTAETALLRAMHRWVDAGMPNLPSFRIHAYPSDALIHAKDRQWITRCTDSQFVWSLKDS